MLETTLDSIVPDRQLDVISRRVLLTIVVAALGYFVDVYDMVLFMIYRVQSLKDIGLASDQLLGVGVNLMNLQMAGMIAGGVVWGMLGDKRGRTGVLFGSILFYSLANLANAFVHDVNTYGVLRFLAGFGLAGEVGAGVTLVSEVMDKSKRSYGSAAFFSIGLFGAVVAALLGKHIPWRAGYFTGGLLGLALLAMRASLFESGIYKHMEKKNIRRGDFKLLLQKGRWKRYAAIICIGVPSWYGGLLIAFLPEFSRALGMTTPLSATDGVLYGYLGVFAGSLAASLVSQSLKSRKKAILLFFSINIAAHLMFFFNRGLSPGQASLILLMSGFGNGFCAIFIMSAAELFGTNLRSTVATTVPNFVRAGTIPMTFALSFLASRVGIVNGALIIEATIVAMALVSLWFVQETFGKDLDYVEN